MRQLSSLRSEEERVGASRRAVMVDMKHAGVVASPMSTGDTPAKARPAKIAAESAGPLSRGSVPTATRSAPARWRTRVRPRKRCP